MTSAAAGGGTTGIPRDGLPQVAVAGRSNVGKSTLINALARRPIARTSAAPGKTRLANVYRLTLEGHGPGRWGLYLVDLPGYGYARGGKSSADELKAVAESYFAAAGVVAGSKGPVPSRASGSGTAPSVLLLMDSRHPGLESDIQAHEWFATLGLEPVIVATKIDKLSRAERARNLRELERLFGKPALPVSAERGEGMEELWKTIANKARAARRAADE